MPSIVNFGAERFGIFIGTGPAIRYNLFIFKEKIKRISTAIGAKGEILFFCQHPKKEKSENRTQYYQHLMIRWYSCMV